MNRIAELIKELCPSGVPYRELSKCVLQNTGGGTPSRARADYWNGQIPWASVGDITASKLTLAETRQTISEAGLSGSSSNLIPAGHVVVAVKIVPGAMRVVERDVAINQDLRGLLLREEVDPYFLTYYFKTIDIGGDGTIVKGITKATLDRVLIPVPPLQVQREIVRILDQFTLLETELETELEAELDARRHQYEHYRKNLLTTDFAKSRSKRLDELFDLRAGKFIAASKIVPKADNVHSVPCYGGGGLRGYVTESNQQGDRVLIGRQGALCGNVKRASGKFYATEHSVVVTPLDGVDIRWAFHLLTSMNLNQYASKSAQPGLAVGTLNKLVVEAPLFDDQVRIGVLLDKFDALVNDLSVSLPAELAARRKQYEYYRDHLLTFQEAVK